jgi:hypothetical protein
LKYSCFRFQEASGEDSRIKTFVIVGQRTPRSSIGLLGTWDLPDKGIIVSCWAHIDSGRRRIWFTGSARQHEFSAAGTRAYSLLRQPRLSPNHANGYLAQQGRVTFWLRSNHDLRPLTSLVKRKAEQ